MRVPQRCENKVPIRDIITALLWLSPDNPDGSIIPTLKYSNRNPELFAYIETYTPNTRFKYYRIAPEVIADLRKCGYIKNLPTLLSKDYATSIISESGSEYLQAHSSNKKNCYAEDCWEDEGGSFQ